MIHQLFCAYPALFDRYAQPIFRNHGQSLVTECTNFWKLLCSVLSDRTIGPVAIVLDGLDGCLGSERRKLIDSLLRLYRRLTHPQKNHSFVKVFVTSRPYQDIEMTLTANLGVDLLRIRDDHELQALRQEVQLVLKERINAMGRQRNWPDDVQDTILLELLKVRNFTISGLHWCSTK
jgi:hypothetical protein